jgi:hypothetical protein
MTLTDAMRSTWDTRPAPETSIADAVGAPAAGASPDAVALAMGLSAANPETKKEQARRILGGDAATSPGSPSATDIMNAMGVSSLRTNLAAARSARLGILPYIPNADTPPEIAQNNLNYLDLMTLKGAGSPLATRFDHEVGSGGSTVDMRRAAVQAMADSGTSQIMTPAERNRRAIIAAMTPSSIPGAPGAAAPNAKQTIQDIMLGYSKAGGTGLSIGEVAKGVDADAREQGANERETRAETKAEIPEEVRTLLGMTAAYKDALAKKDYVNAIFLAKKLGHSVPTVDKLGKPIPFSPESLPGYVADSSAAAANSAPNKGTETVTYATPEEVREALKSGAIDASAATQILQKQFGFK